MIRPVSPSTPSGTSSRSPRREAPRPARGSVEAESLAPLLTPEGWALLSSLPPYDESEALARGERLRAEGHDPALVAAALTQQRLRGRAAAKFGPFAERMLLTPDGLEQATRLVVSAHHASRFASAAPSRVADLGCGIGGDAMALAGLGLPVLAVALFALGLTLGAIVAWRLTALVTAGRARDDLAAVPLGGQQTVLAEFGDRRA